MANSFNKFFAEVGPNLNKKIPKLNILRKPNVYLQLRILHSLLLYPTPPKVIERIISSLDDSKTTGPSSIPIKILKLANRYVSFTFSDVCNTSFNEGIFPEKNKTAKVVPIHKEGSTKEMNNYRPIVDGIHACLFG